MQQHSAIAPARPTERHEWVGLGQCVRVVDIVFAQPQARRPRARLSGTAVLREARMDEVAGLQRAVRREARLEVHPPVAG